MSKTALIYHITNTDREFFLWCLDEESRVICIRVSCNISATVEALLTGTSENTKADPKLAIDKFLEMREISKQSLNITNVTSINKTDIYYYQNGETKPYIQVEFSTIKGYHTFKNLFSLDDAGKQQKTTVLLGQGYSVRLRLMEADIPPLWQFLYKFNIRPCKTIFIPSDKDLLDEGSKTSVCDKEYKVTFVAPTAGDAEISTFPLIFSFDIESYSSDPNMFPNADKIEDVVFFIGIYLKRYRAPASEGKKIGLYVIKEDQLPSTFVSAMGEENTEILCFNTEAELLQKFFDLIVEIRPQIILSYNGLGFDLKYINHRMSVNQLDYPNFSLVKSSCVKGKIRIKQTSWSSSAYKGISCYYFDVPGVVCMDMFFEIKRNYSLKSYTLQEASQYFLKESKVDLKAKEMFKIYKDFLEGNGDKEKLKLIAEYGIQDAVLPTRLFDHLHQWTTYTQMCTVMNIQLIDLIARGQTIRTLSNVYRVTRDRNMIINVPKKKIGYRGKFKGAYVGDMIAGLHDNVLVIDFSSLYPSILASMNLCYTTFIHPDDWSKYTQDQYNEFIVELPNTTTKMRVRYVKTEVYEGIIPSVVRGFLKARKQAKEDEAKAESHDQKIIHNKKQLAVKVSGNSVYGGLGTGYNDGDDNGVVTALSAASCGAQLSLKPIAMTVTSIGQELIKRCNIFIEERGGKVLYNDTDSVFFVMPGTSSDKLLEVGIRMAEEFSRDLPDPVKLEFEKAIRMIGLTPKRYVYRCYSKEGELKPDINSKGVVSTRRDTCQWQSQTFTKVAEAILASLPKRDIDKIIYGAIADILEGKVPIKKLLIGGSIGESYKKASAIMAILKERCRLAGTPLATGSRVEYVVCDTGYVGPKTRAPKLGHRITLVDDIDEKTIKIDYVYYIIHKLKNPIDQLYAKAYDGDTIVEHLVKDVEKDPQSVAKKLRDFIGQQQEEEEDPEEPVDEEDDGGEEE